MKTDFYDRLKLVMQANSLTQISLAEKLKISNVTVSRWMKKGNHEISLTQLQKLFEIFDNVSPVWLITGEGEMSKKRETYSIEKIQAEPERYGNAMLNEIKALKQRIKDLEQFNQFAVAEAESNRKAAESALNLLEDCKKSAKKL